MKFFFFWELLGLFFLFIFSFDLIYLGLVSVDFYGRGVDRDGIYVFFKIVNFFGLKGFERWFKIFCGIEEFYREVW